MGQKEESRRKATVVYSGGDDLFIVGAWDDILELSLDIQQAFQKYTEATLTISAGIGVYQPKFPIHVSAYEVADLEAYQLQQMIQKAFSPVLRILKEPPKNPQFFPNDFFF